VIVHDREGYLGGVLGRGTWVHGYLSAESEVYAEGRRGWAEGGRPAEIDSSPVVGGRGGGRG